MAFSGLFFTLVYLPVFLIVYRLTRTLEGKNRVILIFSIIFYAFSGLRYLALVLLMTLIGWFAGIRIDRSATDRQAKTILAVSCTVFVAVLAVFKYTGFLIETIDHIPGVEIPVPEIALPLGISFYTFKLISYVADVYHYRIAAEPDYSRLLSYVICFHHVTQGPIVRYGDILPQMEDRTSSSTAMARGIYRFCIGLGKKVILANYCGRMADILLPMSDRVSSMPVLSLWLGTVFYMMQMYLDFASYCDMAIGLGHMCGFRYAENFDYPYMSTSIREFWRRWHITLGSFFRDYVYIPLGGNRVSSGRLLFNLFAVWFLTGLWHGASWNFILWGLYFFVFVVLEQSAKKRNLPPAPKWLGHLYVVLVFDFSVVLFRFSDFGQLGLTIRGLFGANGAGLTNPSLAMTFQNNIFFLIYAALACTPFFRSLDSLLQTVVRGRHKSIGIYYTVKTVIALVILVWSIIGMAGDTYTPFLYNQF